MLHMAMKENLRFLETIVNKLILRESIPTPKRFCPGKDVDEHLSSVERYLSAIGVEEEERKVSVLLNSLDDEVQPLLFSQPEFEIHTTDYQWIKEAIGRIFRQKKTTLPLTTLLGVRQSSEQPLKDFVDDLRITAYTMVSACVV